MSNVNPSSFEQVTSLVRLRRCLATIGSALRSVRGTDLGAYGWFHYFSTLKVPLKVVIQCPETPRLPATYPIWRCSSV